MSDEAKHPLRSEPCWAAIDDDRVVHLVSMRAPSTLSQDRFRTLAESSRESLAKLGSVRAGTLKVTPQGAVFEQRLSHKNRSKNPRTPRAYPVSEDVLAGIQRFMDD